MSRRTVSIVLVLGFLLVSALMLVKTRVSAQGPTPTPFPTSPAQIFAAPLSGSSPLTVEFSHIGGAKPLAYCIWMFGDGTTQTFTNAPGSSPLMVCPSASHLFRYPGNYSPALTVVTTNGSPSGSHFVNVNVAGPTPSPTPQNNPVPDLRISGLVYEASTTCPENPLLTLAVANNGGAVNTPFQVTFNGETRTINSMEVNQGVMLNFNAVFGTKTASVDVTNVIAEANESNNSTTFVLPLPACGVPTLTPTRTPSLHVPTRTFTPTTGPVTLTPTRTRTPTPTGTGGFPTVVRTPTRTNTPTAGPTSAGACSPVTSTITVPFTFDGAGPLCWQASSLGSFINSWNTTSVTLNGVNVTNMWVPVGSYPAKIGGFYYVSYNAGSFGHFEARP